MGEQPGLVLLPLLVQLDNLSLEGHLHVKLPFVKVDCLQVIGQLLLLQTFLQDIKVVRGSFLLMGEGGVQASYCAWFNKIRLSTM